MGRARLCAPRTSLRAMLAAALLMMIAITASRRAWAQPAPTPEEVQQAQSRWKEGKAFFDAGNFEAARVAFRQAYTIFPHPAFLQNLGEAELRSARYVEAARHLAQYLHISTSGSPAQRDGAKGSLKKATEKLGAVVVETNVEDAEIRVDDELVGRSPLGSLAWYVEPGRHMVVARKPGFIDSSDNVEVAVGSVRNVYVRLARLLEYPGNQPAAPLADTRPAPKPARTELAASTAARASPESAPSEARTVVLLSGATLTVAALTVGAIYAVRSTADSNNLASARGTLMTSQVCFNMRADHEATCRAIDDAAAALQTDRTVRNVSLGVAGALGVVTVSTFFLWPARARTTATPAVGPGYAGVQVQGQF